MIDALIAGRIHGQPAERTSKTGKPFAVCKVRVPTGAEDSVFVSCIAFDADPVKALLALGDKDSVALAGTIIPKVWSDSNGNAKPALDMTVHAVISPYHVTRKRRAMQDRGNDLPSQPKDSAWRAQDFPPSTGELDF